jgi:hypothetical protein
MNTFHCPACLKKFQDTKALAEHIAKQHDSLRLNLLDLHKQLYHLNTMRVFYEHLRHPGVRESV